MPIDEGDDRLRLAALGRAYGRFEEALAATHACDILRTEAGVERPELLEEAVKRNPFVREAWVALADAAVGGRLPPKRGRRKMMSNVCH